MGHQWLVLLLFALFTQDSTAKNHENTNNLILENECGLRKESKISLRIYDGSPAEQGDHPWMASLALKQDPAFHICGGTIISPKHILTAAHCFINKDQSKNESMHRSMIKADDILISFGSVNSTKNVPEKTGDEFRAELYEIHPNYNNKSTSYDIAIIKLKKKVTFSEHVRSICLPEKNDPSYSVGTKVYIAGWGATAPGSNGTEILMENDVLIRDMDECKKLLKKVGFDNFIEKLEICAGDKTGSKDTCGGDSGGPLIARREKDGRWIQLGITSWGKDNDCGHENDTVGMYTKVDQYLDWIAKVVNKN